ncbi:putative cadmium/zinc-transporting ATPase 3 [Hordeum vulgare]|nr:putative cadmium/zinc-transporting ATPase 3 [Hordeum vulgare]
MGFRMGSCSCHRSTTVTASPPPTSSGGASSVGSCSSTTPSNDASPASSCWSFPIASGCASSAGSCSYSFSTQSSPPLRPPPPGNPTPDPEVALPSFGSGPAQEARDDVGLCSADIVGTWLTGWVGAAVHDEAFMRANNVTNDDYPYVDDYPYASQEIDDNNLDMDDEGFVSHGRTEKWKTRETFDASKKKSVVVDDDDDAAGDHTKSATPQSATKAYRPYGTKKVMKGKATDNVLKDGFEAIVLARKEYPEEKKLLKLQEMEERSEAECPRTAAEEKRAAAEERLAAAEERKVELEEKRAVAEEMNKLEEKALKYMLMDTSTMDAKAKAFVELCRDEVLLKKQLLIKSMMGGMGGGMGGAMGGAMAELSAYIGDYSGSSFSWVISETARLVFSVPFPSVEILKVCTRDVIKCPINKFLILIKKVEEIPDLVSPLEQVWVYIFGLPERDKRDHILKAVLEPVGNFRRLMRPLAARFQRLFSFVADPFCTAEEVFNAFYDESMLSMFHFPLSDQAYQELLSVKSLLQALNIDPQAPDRWVWGKGC